MRNHEVTTSHKLLDENGHIIEPGWARQLYWQYNRDDIRLPKFRIKEWDYYLVLAQEFGLAFTISDDGYIGLQSASFLDFTAPREHTETILDAFPLGKLALPPDSSAGRTYYHKEGRLTMEFYVEDIVPGKRIRHIKCDFKKFDGEKDLSCDIRLEQPDMDTMCIATPFAENPKCFYYNQKINCMRASGEVIYDGRSYRFNPETDFGTLDWGRGVWTYDNTWYWGSGNGIVNGKPFGFNIGYGFSDRSSASENLLFYDGRAHKLDDITFHIPSDSYTKPWTFTSSDGRFEMDFVPIIDRCAKIDVKAIVTDQHQVFGRMSGKAVLDDGEVLEIKDLLCFAEKVHNRY